MKIYLVGGAVRDKLLNLPVKDRDWVVVGTTPEQMLALGYKQVGQDFPVFLHPKTNEEYALARTERKTGAGYTGFQFHTSTEVSLEQDLQRRDLTINAIAEDENGVLIDPYGGQTDLEAGLLRHVSPAFSEDPVRILRIARFAARFGVYGFHVAHSTHALMKAMVKHGEVDALVSERVWQELSRALAEPQPQRFFQVLYSCGALARLLPEWLPLFTTTDTHQHKNQTQGSQALQQAVKADLTAPLRFALLNGLLLNHHDIPQALASLKQLSQRWHVPKYYQLLSEKIINHQADFKACDTASPEQLLILLEQLDVFRRAELLRDFLQVCNYSQTQIKQVEILQTAFDICKNINAKALVKQGLRGAEIGQALRQQRIQKLTQAMALDG